jgi:hypothetical protein
MVIVGGWCFSTTTKKKKSLVTIYIIITTIVNFVGRTGKYHSWVTNRSLLETSLYFG